MAEFYVGVKRDSAREQQYVVGEVCLGYAEVRGWRLEQVN